MIKITLTVDGSTEELAPILRYISDIKPSKSNNIEIVEGAAEISESLEPYWTESKVRKVWWDLTLGCRKILEEIAEYDGGVSWGKLLGDLKLNPNSAGGMLSSLGHRLRSHGYVDLSPPLMFTKDYDYTLEPVWRQTILKIKKELEAIQPDRG